MKERVAVVGAGIAGRLLALRLNRLGFAVSLFERDSRGSRGNCSHAAAGLLTPASEGAAASEPEVVRLGLDARLQWAALLATLNKPVVLGEHGSLVTAYRQDEPLLDEFIGRLRRRHPAVACAKVERERMLQLEPGLKDAAVACGVHLPDEGYIQSHQALDALLSTLEAEGVRCLFDTPVADLAPFQLTTADGRERFDLICDCRGVAAKAELSDLRGVRGELIEVYAPEVRLTLPLQILHLRYPTYVVPRGNDVYAIGATCLESESMAPVTVKAALELLTAAYELHPGFRFAQIIRLVANCRPAFADHLPRVLQAPGLWRINGLYRHGFLLAPVVTELVARQLTGRLAPADAGIFREVAA